MKIAVIVSVALALCVRCQEEVDDETKKKIDELFPQGNTSNSNPTRTGADGGDFFSNMEEVNPVTLSSYGAAEKCGEGSTRGLRMCVNYHMCDGKTNTIIQSGVTDGFGIIDIRFGTNACPHFLEVCCRIPEGGLDPNLPLPDAGTTQPPTGPVGPVTFPDTIPSSEEPPVNTETPVIPISTKPSYCGIRNPNGIDFKITGAKDNEAEYGEFPWVVAIVNKNYRTLGLTNQLICGGSLITPNVVLTAAHCVSKSKNFDLAVRAGEWDTQTTRERIPYQEIGVREIRTHPNFNNGNLFNDFALLILQQSVVKADNVGTICLPRQGQRISSRNCFVSGWGKDQFGKSGQYQTILKKIELPTVDRSRCQRLLRGTRLGGQFILDKSFVCAGGEQGKDVCTGDGGSPLVCPDPDNPSRYMQAGIVAWGIGCGDENIPGVYGDVSQFRSWIDNEVSRLNIDNTAYTL
ncbi:unnamed protein product [Phyllotreta striolata]|uniref:Phenoloxidase-activating factor 2 n=1 Tax=Phyllotreta striolata TaxID=444603 RepID=A0A9N9T9A8_PHYSR|nr:unnamed protein product [Phyllotreta striolata]